MFLVPGALTLKRKSTSGRSFPDSIYFLRPLQLVQDFFQPDLTAGISRALRDSSTVRKMAWTRTTACSFVIRFNNSSLLSFDRFNFERYVRVSQRPRRSPFALQSCGDPCSAKRDNDAHSGTLRVMLSDTPPRLYALLWCSLTSSFQLNAN